MKYLSGAITTLRIDAMYSIDLLVWWELPFSASQVAIAPDKYFSNDHLSPIFRSQHLKNESRDVNGLVIPNAASLTWFS
jgi:hypothetical protein